MRCVGGSACADCVNSIFLDLKNSGRAIYTKETQMEIIYILLVINQLKGIKLLSFAR